MKKSDRGFLGAPGPFPDLPSLLGYPERWLVLVRTGHSRSAAAKLLKFAPEHGLFDCFLAALRSKGLAADLLAWMDSQGDGFTLRRVALSGPGRDFDGASALAMLGDRMDEVRELLGDPEWAARAMAVRILSEDTSRAITQRDWPTAWPIPTRWFASSPCRPRLPDSAWHSTKKPTAFS